MRMPKGRRTHVVKCRKSYTEKAGVWLWKKMVKFACTYN
jgi:hypothetical protein